MIEINKTPIIEIPQNIKNFYIIIIGLLVIYSIYYQIKYKQPIEKFKPQPQPRKKKFNKLKKSKKQIEKFDDFNKQYDENIEKLKKIQRDEEDKDLRKYNEALTKYMEFEKNKKLSINLLDIGNSLESGLADLTTEIGDKLNPAPEQFKGHPVKTMELKTNRFTRSKIDNTELVEGFRDNKNEKNDDNGIIKYVLDTTQYYTKTAYDEYGKTAMDKFTDVTGIMIKDEYLIPSGILMITIGFGLFFIDISV